MKNIIILLLILAVGVLGYLYISSSNDVATDSATSTTETQQDFTNRPPPPGGPGGSPGGQTLTAEEKAQCGITATVTEGPYYVSGAPALSDGNLNYDNLEGSPLKVSGYVYEGLDDTKPITNAEIDLWQTDMDGSYHPNANGSISQYSDDEISLRGVIETDENGYYEFHTVYPGEYTGRTRHIHVKVRAPEKDELTTQLILSLNGDDISFDEDTVSQGLPNCHLLSLNADTPPTEATFDFRLAE